MIIEIGHFLFIVAFVLSLYQMSIPFFPSFYHCHRKIALRLVSFSICVFTILSFLCLVYTYSISDFSVLNVVKNSHSEQPLLYKITGVWGNHEGSMLLWITVLTCFSAWVGVWGKNLPASFVTVVALSQNCISCIFFSFILFSSNPFLRCDPPALQGEGLNPILQDISFAIHPPLLYLGFVGFSVCFSLAIAALYERRVDALFGYWLRPWVFVSWIFLTAGIITGSYWAYYELGWGGYWFWDPVENASLMPWLTATALLHSSLVLEKRSSLKVWTIFLAILTFSLSLLGLFLVRSGILISVHSFATDSLCGLFIFSILLFFTGGGFLLFAFRAPFINENSFFQPLSREGAVILNNLFLSAAATTIFIGTLYPLFLEAITGTLISVGAPFFNLTFSALFAPLLMIFPFGSLLSWKKGDFIATVERLWLGFAIALTIFFLVLYQSAGSQILAACFLGLSAWVIVGAFTDLGNRAGGIQEKSARGQKKRIIISLKTFWQRLQGLPGAVWGAFFAHVGVGILLWGIFFVIAFGEEKITTLALGDTLTIAGKQIRFDKYEIHSQENYHEHRFYFTLLDEEKNIHSARAAKRIFPLQGVETIETTLIRSGLSHYYIMATEAQTEGKIIIHIWWKPWILCLWLGGLFMMVGGFLSLKSRYLSC